MSEQRRPTRKRRNTAGHETNTTAATAAGAGLDVISPIGVHANLLPDEFYQARREAKAVNIAAVAVIMLVVLGGLTSYGAYLYAQNASAQLSVEEQRTALIRTQRNKYAAVTQINGELSVAGNAQETALFAESDWETISAQFRAGLPAGTDYTLIDLSEPSLNSSTNTAAGGASSGSAGSTNPLLPAKTVISINFTLQNTAFVSAADIIDGLSTSVKGYQNATVDSVTGGGSSSGANASGYTISGTLMLDVSAVSTDRANAGIDKQRLEADRQQLSASNTVNASGSGK